METNPRKSVGAVVIARNEGERLRRGLKALLQALRYVVYVDSGSTDGSVAFARSAGAEVVELDLSVPFTMARARNSGWRRLLEVHPDCKFVQFIDGDCEMIAGWIDHALDAIEVHRTIAAVCGLRKERHPEASPYNRFCAIEWRTPVGVTRSCGGDCLVRVEALRQSNGMNEGLIAGEEPEWCFRLQRDGWVIVRIDHDMTWHDAAIHRFSQWWKRNLRGGYGALDVYLRTAEAFPDVAPVELPFQHLVTSSAKWVKLILIALPVGAVGGMVGFGLIGGPAWFGALFGAFGLAVALVLFQGWRIGKSVRERESSPLWRFRYGLFTVIAKFPQFLGMRKYRRDLAAGRVAQLIEYK